MKKYVKDIKINEKVNRREKGWQKVVSIRRQFLIYLTFENGEEVGYTEYDRLITC